MPLLAENKADRQTDLLQVYEWFRQTTLGERIERMVVGERTVIPEDEILSRVEESVAGAREKVCLVTPVENLVTLDQDSGRVKPSRLSTLLGQACDRGVKVEIVTTKQTPDLLYLHPEIRVYFRPIRDEDIKRFNMAIIDPSRKNSVLILPKGSKAIEGVRMIKGGPRKTIKEWEKNFEHLIL